MNRLFLIFLGAVALAHSGAARQPNVLILMADQWRGQAFGYAGDPNVRTPHLDKLARESVNLTQAIANVPVCGPSRASLFTGQRALTHGVFMNDVPLRNEAVTFAEVLKAKGYDTGYVGKWHLNGDGHRAGFIPRERRQGFEYWKALECTHDYNDSFYYADTPEKLKWEGYDAFAQTKDAQQYLRNHAKNKKPFLFMLSWGPPHSPYQSAPKKYRDMYDPEKLLLRPNVPADAEKKVRRELAGYYAHCSALDDCVGDLLSTLQKEGLREETIVIFTADHGDMLGSHGMSAKQKPFEESIRIPLLIRWPEKIPARFLDSIFTTEDFAPTLLGLCGATIPRGVEGIVFSNHLRGGNNPSDNTAIVSCVAPFGEWDRRRGGKEIRALRTTRYTYVKDLDGPWLLFDNQADPFQQTNLVNKLQAQGQLERQLKQKLEARGDEFQTAEFYIQKWGYHTNATGTVPYTN